MSEKIAARLQTPVDEAGERKDVHLINTTDELIVYPESEDPITGTDWVEKVDDVLGNLDKVLNGVVAISDEIPQKEDIDKKSFIWLKPLNYN